MSFWKNRRKYPPLFVVEVLLCARCEEQAGFVSCVECESQFCLTCCDELHYRGQWKSHKLLPLRFPVLTPRKVTNEEEQMMDSMIVHSMYEPPLSQDNNDEFASTPEDAPIGANFQNVILEPKDFLGNSDEFYEEPKSLENSTDDSKSGKMEIQNQKKTQPPLDIEVESHSSLLQKASTAKRKSIFEAMKEGKLILQVDIEDYLELQCAKTVTEFFEQKDTVRAALYHLATRNSVSIDLSNGKDELFDIFYVNANGDHVIMDKNKLLDEYGLTYKQKVILKKIKTGKAENKLTNKIVKRASMEDVLKEGKIVLYFEILDYEILNCVKRASDFFDADKTILEAFKRIANKNSVSINLENGRENFFQLFYTTPSGEVVRLEKDKTLRQIGLSTKDIIQIKMMDN